ncbi:SCO family protein [Bartonella ancashensis]|uniref:Cytochrome oxidase biogenesis protein Sco1/SenC/PrrC, putative copper metallochaperone n=1 Tax=Bartonella ancashensis TaxID=1318743 RepID=A0A0M4LSY5_9HYPH|nr:SCO family protein [Bartonella ancashensis]ALE03634.1 Cytochrome oxidase biogenesis protein Sco1/SenC/PrrC, putative copper metallochaperone [Bartonella ancashensis]
MRSVVYILSLSVLFIAGVITYDKVVNKPLGDSFVLLSSDGETITEADIRSKPAAIFFGYTTCPEVCPTTSANLDRWLSEIGPDAEKLGVWFVTIDPEYDTPEVLHEYLSNFKSKIVGISGNAEDVKKMISSFNIVAQKIPGTSDDNYTYDHTSAVLLLKKGGKLAGKILYSAEESETEDKIAITQLKKLVSE